MLLKQNFKGMNHKAGKTAMAETSKGLRSRTYRNFCKSIRNREHPLKKKFLSKDKNG